MDARKLGSFIAENRKAKNMTQVDLAIKLQVTDKAISRWERGLGFPDINSIEQLAEELDVSIAELMKCERIQEEPVSHAEVENAIINTLDIAITEKREERKKVFHIVWISIMLVILLLVIESTKWNLSMIVFLCIGVILPVASGISGLALAGRGLWRWSRHKSAKQTFISAVICIVIYDCCNCFGHSGPYAASQA